MPYQFYNPAPVFLDLDGLQLAANGSLTFYDVGTVTPRNTWSDYDQTTPNANPIPLDPDARSPNQIYMDGDYTVVCKDELDAVVWTRDIYSPTQAGASIPALDNGKFLTNDGSNLLWAALLQVPDPTGSTNHYLTTDGANLLWTTIPETPDLQIEVTASTFQAGVSTDDTKWFVQSGSATAPASGSFTTSQTITFSTAFSTAPVVCVMPTSNSQPGGPVVWSLTSAPSTTAFTVQFDIAEGASPDANIVNSIPYQWIAFGTREVPA